MRAANHLHTSVWFHNLDGYNNDALQSLLRIWEEQNLKFIHTSRIEELDYGVIIIKSIEQLDFIRDLMLLQLRGKSKRIILIHAFSQAEISNESIFKILDWGIEYVFPLEIVCRYSLSVTDILTRWRNIDSIRRSSVITDLMKGESTVMIKILRNLIEVAVYSSLDILIEGERGTGKELFANIIHNLYKKDGKLVLLDCTTIKPELSGSEFFGHEKGAFTGAESARDGAFAIADNGTLFLDEVGELPSRLQSELLRVIQEGIYKKLGSNLWRKTQFRLVCATNRDLSNEANAGNFRKDLLDRISTWQLKVPSLSERKEDIGILVEFFFRKFLKRDEVVIEEPLKEFLNNREYPGNIRELKHLIHRIAISCKSNAPITLGDVPYFDRKFKAVKTTSKWYESESFTHSLEQAIEEGNDMDFIESKVVEQSLKIALAKGGNTKNVSGILNKSERWVQIIRAKEKI